MTQTADRTDSTAGPFGVEPAPRRPLRSRLAIGHLIMVLAGLLAFLLVLAVLRERDTVTEIAVSDVQIDAGTVLVQSDVRLATLGDLDATLLDVFLTTDEIDRAIAESWVAARTLPAGAPLTAKDFRREVAASELRAMSVPIGATHAVNAAIVPGDRIDIIVVDRGRPVMSPPMSR